MTNTTPSGADDLKAILAFNLLSAANYIDVLGGDSKKYRDALPAAQPISYMPATWGGDRAALSAAQEAPAQAAQAVPEDVADALRPFAEIGAWLFARAQVPDDDPVVDVHHLNGVRTTLTRGQFKAAHRALQSLDAAPAAPQPAAQHSAPVAWMDDGTLRAGSESTAFRVVTDETKRGMLASTAESFKTPLYLHPAQAQQAAPAAQPAEGPVAWGAFHFGGKRDGQLYQHASTEEAIRSYIKDRHLSDDTITLIAAPLYRGQAPATYGGSI